MRLVTAHSDSVAGGLGLLFYGPPGTGKTLLIRHLISRCEDYTIVIPADMAVETLRETFRLAKYLQPAVIVLEDVDLLAHHREMSIGNEGLQELMNQLDGLSATNKALVLMSTNRPEIIEPALGSRPGRVSQVIEVPLPNGDARKLLFDKFLRSHNVDNIRVDHWVERTEGASPAFLKELCHRAILLATEVHNDGRTQNGGLVKISDADFERAIYELVVMSGRLSANVLGFPKYEN